LILVWAEISKRTLTQQMPFLSLMKSILLHMRLIITDCCPAHELLRRLCLKLFIKMFLLKH